MQISSSVDPAKKFDAAPTPALTIQQSKKKV
jgi:hypothetical protein